MKPDAARWQIRHDLVGGRAGVANSADRRRKDT